MATTVVEVNDTTERAAQVLAVVVVVCIAVLVVALTVAGVRALL